MAFGYQRRVADPKKVHTTPASALTAEYASHSQPKGPKACAGGCGAPAGQ
jgi:hypothetical protein